MLRNMHTKLLAQQQVYVIEISPFYIIDNE